MDPLIVVVQWCGCRAGKLWRFAQGHLITTHAEVAMKSKKLQQAVIIVTGMLFLAVGPEARADLLILE